MSAPVPNLESIPDELKALTQWVVWKLEPVKGRDKPAKMPYNPKTGNRADTTDPDTWTSFNEAVKVYQTGKYLGIGFVFTEETGIIFLDWDDPDLPIHLYELYAYTEVSQSGKGFHIFLKGKLPEGTKHRTKNGKIELYENKRFCAITGHKIDENHTEIKSISDDAIKAICHKYSLLPSPVNANTDENHSVNIDLSDDEIIKIIGNSSQSGKFSRLMKGDISEYGDDDSSADIGLCCILAFYTKDIFQIERLWRSSGLWREKSNTRPEYVIKTIQKALEKVPEQYTGKRNKQIKTRDSVFTDLKEQDDRDKKPITLVKVYTNEPPEIQMYKVLNGLNLCNCPPALFVRSGEMVRIVNDEHDYPAIERVSEVALRTRIYDCIEFLSRKEVKSKNEGSTWKENKIRPPIDVIRDVIHSRLWVNKFPAIVGITETPVIYPDGSILSEPGYDKETCLYYAPSPGLKIPPIPLEPSQEDVKKALKTIWEPFKEFTFVDKADGTHILAGLISIVCRNLINGNIPILLIDKPTPGTGASLISQIIGLISEGRDPAINSMPATEEEWKKQIISLLINGRPSVILDNIEGRLKSPALAALLTTQEYSDRLLGTNENVTYTHRMVWIGNGNNITLGGDLPRRSYWSRMDSESVRPWMDDKKYTHPDLRKWTMDNRGDILASILTITRSWIQAGRPKPSENIPKIGGFEQWRDVIGGILEHAGIDGFLGNLQLMYDTTDTETPQWDLFTETWFKTFEDKPQPTSEIFKAITPIKSRDGITFCNHQELRDSLPEMLLDALEREGSFTKILGNALTKRKDRRYPSGYMIKKAGEKRRAVQWKVVKIEIQSKLSPEDTR